MRFTDDFKYTFGYSNSFANDPDSYSTRRGWGHNPFALCEKGMWGELIMQNKCNSVTFYTWTSGVFIPEGTKVEIFGAEA